MRKFLEKLWGETRRRKCSGRRRERKTIVFVLGIEIHLSGNEKKRERGLTRYLSK